MSKEIKLQGFIGPMAAHLLRIGQPLRSFAVALDKDEGDIPVHITITLPLEEKTLTKKDLADMWDKHVMGQKHISVAEAASISRLFNNFIKGLGFND